MTNTENRSVSYNTALLARTLLITLALLWPLLVFSHPSYIPDSVAYLKGGAAASSFAASKLEHTPPVPLVRPEKLGNLPHQEMPKEAVKGARSVWYSAAAYLLRGPSNSMIALAVAQAILAALLCAILLLSVGATSWAASWATASILAIATPLPYVVSFMTPDIFAGLLIASYSMLAMLAQRLSRGIVATLIAVAGFAIAAHASHPPLAIVMFVASISWTKFGLDAKDRYFAKTFAVLAAPLALGLAATLAGGFIAFKDMSLAPKRYPLALARSVSDGPARWYLEKECAKPKYAVCEVFGRNIPNTIAKFIFTPGGLAERASADQMDRIRKEEPEIVIRAAIRYPVYEIRNLSYNIFRQMISFRGSYYQFDQIISQRRGEELHLNKIDNPLIIPLQNLFDIFYIIIALLSIPTAWAFWKGNRQALGVLALTTTGIFANIIICVVFSGVTDRYQARTIWLLAVLMIAALEPKIRNISIARHPNI